MDAHQYFQLPSKPQHERDCEGGGEKVYSRQLPGHEWTANGTPAFQTTPIPQHRENITNYALPRILEYLYVFICMQYDGYSLPQGANIIGILEGSEWGTANDRPTLVGAHWDTVAFTPGTDDNGSGTAAMLEAARAISHSGCTPKYSLIFVAFDLEEVGSQGSLLFIKDFLSQILKTDSPHDVPLERFQVRYL